jgi:hypothetical protein
MKEEKKKKTSTRKRKDAGASDLFLGFRRFEPFCFSRFAASSSVNSFAAV